MKIVLLQKAIKLNRERKYRKSWQKVAVVLTAVVVFCTTYALILPAITMERNPVCGYEAHEHGESCYTQQPVYDLQCSLEVPADCAVIHTHQDVCYDAGGVLRCTLPELVEHIHEDACYEITELSCGLEESEDHVHSEDCASVQKTLICTREEIYPHLHEENCYDGAGNLTCRIPQTVAHQHDESCLAVTEQTVQVLTCEIPEHVHEDACYPLENTEPTETEYLCGSGEHTHSEDCYDAEGNLACTIPEHTHEAACIVADLDLTADVETAADWEKTLEDVQLTGVWPEDVLAVAESQLGYRESTRNCVLADGELMGYTRYGAWYGIPYGDWCAMFASFCLDYAGVEDFPLESGCEKWIRALEEEELYAAADTYTPKPGDLIFFDYDQKEDAEVEIEADHVGLVAELIPATATEPAQIKTIEGNTSDKVDYVTYEMDDVAIIGYGVLPEQMFYCGKTVHIHDETCYDEQTNLICGKEAHVHDDSCTELNDEYIASTLPLICTIEEHTHTAACYAEDGETLTCTQSEHRHTLECYGPATASFTYEDDSVSMTVNVSSYAGIPEGVSMTLSQLDPDSDAYWNYADYAAENQDGELFNLLGYQIHFYLAGEEIELADAEITAELTIKPVSYEAPKVAAFSLRSQLGEGDEEEEEEKNVLVTVLQDAGGTIGESGSASFTGDSDTGATVTLTMSGARTFALAARSVANPEFTVEFYANLKTFQSTTTEPENGYTLQIIDTRGNGDGTGGDLPNNGQGYDGTGTEKGVLYLPLKATERTTDQMDSEFIKNSPGATATVYEVAAQTKLTQVYSDELHTYISGMNVMSVDKLHENSHYELSQIWVSNDGGENWTVYTESDEEVSVEGYAITEIVKVTSLHDMEFTNDSGYAAESGALLISDGYLVRMVYDLLEGTHNFSANIFDYDITDTQVYLRSKTNSWEYYVYDNVDAAVAALNRNRGLYDGNIYMWSSEYGINSENAYLTSGGTAQFAFGNQNTGVVHRLDKLNGYYINGGNDYTFKTCFFGLVTGYDIKNDRLIYASGIDHQALFNDDAYYNVTVPGKQPYYNQTLNFKRTGDTYVLSAVNGGNSSNGVYESNLDEFILPGYAWDTTIPQFTNNFWPLDGTTSDSNGNHDMEFGDFDETYNRAYYGENGVSTGLPESDDGEPHNSYFGMQYSVKFTLDGEYCGPLEYLFYGDDDMWVFLTDEKGNSVQICDIGGVHGSVGSYTDLWDYIKKGTVGNYTLTFFYTERGATGSSCYMEFTLPQVTSITQNTPTTGSVSVAKKVENVTDTTTEFEFKFELSGSVPGINDNFAYVIKDTDDNKISDGTIKTGDTFKLKANQTITVSGIPAGLKYTITEQTQGGYDVAWVDSSGKVVDGAAVTGTIVKNTTHQVTCTNSAVGSLKLTKELVGSAVEARFQFEVTLTDAAGESLSGTYGTVAFTDGKALVTVKTSESVTIPDIPVGSRFTVTEMDGDGYTVTYEVDGKTVDVASGTIGHNQTVEVKVINAQQYSLPATGGMGTSFFTFGGLLIVAAALMYSCTFGRRRRKGGR